MTARPLHERRVPRTSDGVRPTLWPTAHPGARFTGEPNESNSRLCDRRALRTRVSLKAAMQVVSPGRRPSHGRLKRDRRNQVVRTRPLPMSAGMAPASNFASSFQGPRRLHRRGPPTALARPVPDWIRELPTRTPQAARRASPRSAFDPGGERRGWRESIQPDGTCRGALDPGSR